MSLSFLGLEASLLIKGNNVHFIISKCITLCMIIVVVVGAMRCWYCMHLVFTRKKARCRKKRCLYFGIIHFNLHITLEARGKRQVAKRFNFLPICPGKGDSRQQQSHQPAAQQSITEREAATAASLSCKHEHGLLKQLRGTERLEQKPWLRMN